MTGEDEEELSQNYARVAIPVSTTGLVLLIPVLILFAMNQWETRSRNAKITKWLMVGVLSTNGINQSLFVLKYLTCGYCKAIWGSWLSSKAFVKGFNLLFLIHRAKLVQGMNPILSERWFEKIFPTITVVVICGFIFSVLMHTARTEYVCTSFEDWSDGHICVMPVADQDADGTRGIAAAALAMDTLITLFLMVLFIVPLYRVYNVDIGPMNPHQIKQRRKLKDLLIWSVVMTFINQVTSTFYLIRGIHTSQITFVLFTIGLYDPAINAWTAWLMIPDNRQYLRNLCCFVCQKFKAKDDVIRPLSVSGLTDVPSRSATSTNVKSSQSCVDIELVQMNVFETELVARILPTGTKS